MLTLRRAEGAKSKTSCLSNYRFGPFRLNASTPVARNGTLGFAFLQSTQLGCRPHDNITNWFELIFVVVFRGGGHFFSLFSFPSQKWRLLVLSIMGLRFMSGRCILPFFVCQV